MQYSIYKDGEMTLKQSKDWKCQECGHLMTLRAAKQAALGDSGCRKCGSSDIDIVEAYAHESSRIKQ